MSETKPQHILITGFMGAGKTTIARALAQHLNCEWLDLDQFIAERDGRTIAAMIDEEGLTAFRAKETRALRDVLKQDVARIIALGGGAWTLARNRSFISKHDALTIWLDAPFDLCWERINAKDNSRPLARSRQKAERLYERRHALYGLAPLRVEIDAAKSAGDTAVEIARALSLR